MEKSEKHLGVTHHDLQQRACLPAASHGEEPARLFIRKTATLLTKKDECILLVTYLCYACAQTVSQGDEFETF